MKNFLIVVLGIACGILVYLLLNTPKNEPCVECQPPQIIKVEKTIEKMSPYDVIKMASIHGISLETPLDQIDTLTKEAGYECLKKESKIKMEDGSPDFIYRQCQHEALKSSFRIEAQKGIVTRIIRSGDSYMTDMDYTVEHLVGLRSRLNALGGLYIAQSGKSQTFHIDYKKEDKSTAFARYYLGFIKNNEDDVQSKVGGTLTVGITR